MALLFINAFTVSSIFRVRAYGSDALDFQILFKLGVWAATLGACLLFIRRWGGYLLRFDNIALSLLIVLMTVSCFYAPSTAYSLGSVFSVIATFSLLFCATSVLSVRAITMSIISALTAVSIISIAMYFTYPEFARMSEWINGSYGPGSRLSGITGTANTMGFLAAFCLILCAHAAHNIPRKYWIILAVFIAVNAVALIMSNSRTSIAGLGLALAVVYFVTTSPTRWAFAFLGAACVLMGTLFIDSEALYSSLSRSGDAAEITTGTGRVFIWKTALKLTGDKILSGWGYASSVRILPALSSEIGFMPPHTHNLFLQVAFATGIGGLFLIILSFLTKTYYALRRGDRFQLAGIIFIIITGLTEASSFQGVATASTLALAVILAVNFKQTGRPMFIENVGALNEDENAEKENTESNAAHVHYM